MGLKSIIACVVLLYQNLQPCLVISSIKWIIQKKIVTANLKYVALKT